MPYRLLLPLLGTLGALLAGCATTPPAAPPSEASWWNLAHLDALGETTQRGDTTYRIVHIYAEAPDYAWVGDDDEGVACVDDAARAAVLYLRAYELHGDDAARRKATELIHFLFYMQQPDGLFHNFVWDAGLRVNREHENSRAEPFGWWAARGVWALGTCARILAEADPALAGACAERVRRTYPHLDAFLARHGETTLHEGRTVPQWLLYETAADATSELLLGLIALEAAAPDTALRRRIDRFADGLERMRYGSMNEWPYGAHASWIEAWHGWGNSQTQALAEAGRLTSAAAEAEQFYPRLLVDGWMHSMDLDEPGAVRRFEQIAYAVRTVAVGLARLHEATGERRYAVMAGLAASWLTGNNVASTPMYDPATGRGYDGIGGPDEVNRNAGAESTIEATYTLLEVERLPEARRWLHARGGPAHEAERDGHRLRYRIFTPQEGAPLAVAMDLTDETLLLLEGDALHDIHPRD